MNEKERCALIEGAARVLDDLGIMVFIPRRGMGTRLRIIHSVMGDNGYTWDTCPECGGKGGRKLSACYDCELTPIYSGECHCGDILPVCPACNGHGNRWCNNKEASNGS